MNTENLIDLAMKNVSADLVLKNAKIVNVFSHEIISGDIAIQNGIDPITAIQMATINAATCYNLKNTGAIAPGYNADFLIVNNLKDFNVEQVFKKGKLVGKNKKSMFETKEVDTSRVVETVKINKINKEDLVIKLNDDIVNVIRLLHIV